MRFPKNLPPKKSMICVQTDSVYPVLDLRRHDVGKKLFI